jgi:hypothetical protein
VTLEAPCTSATALSLFNLDAVSAAGATFDNCTFSSSGSNLGRFKSSGGRVSRTLFRNTASQNLKISPLQNWLEGPLGLHNVTIEDCVFEGTTVSPVHVFGAVDVREVNDSYIG